MINKLWRRLMGLDKKPSRRSCKRYNICPACGTIFIDWDPAQKRWRCLVHSCHWMEEEMSDPGCYNYATGSCWYGYGLGHREPNAGMFRRFALWANNKLTEPKWRMRGG